VGIGLVGRAWAGGLELGEQASQIILNGTQIGEVYLLIQAQTSLVLITHALPEFTVHSLASTILGTLKPSRVAILDTYPDPAYISSTPPRALDHPIRFLSTRRTKAKPATSVLAFEAPNLIKSLSACLLSILETRPATPGTLLLVPSLRIPPPPPALRPVPYSSSAREFWQDSVLGAVNDTVISFIDEKNSGRGSWDAKRAREFGARKGHVREDRKGDVGEGGMYI